MHATLALLVDTGFPQLRRRRLETLQVNLGYRCNQRCVHCHVNAGPNRTEMMDAVTTDLVLRERPAITTLDLTGGAPELNPRFRWLEPRREFRRLVGVSQARMADSAS
jgi:MoaA/NifB/PqqE/SkfB family radical SAM enzyme